MDRGPQARHRIGSPLEGADGSGRAVVEGWGRERRLRKFPERSRDSGGAEGSYVTSGYVKAARERRPEESAGRRASSDNGAIIGTRPPAGALLRAALSRRLYVTGGYVRALRSAAVAAPLRELAQPPLSSPPLDDRAAAPVCPLEGAPDSVAGLRPAIHLDPRHPAPTRRRRSRSDSRTC